MSIVGVLRKSLGYCTGRSGASDHLAGVVDRLTPGITRLYAGATMRDRPGERRLQRVIGGVRGAGNQIFNTEPADHGAGAVELGIWREAGAGVGIGIGKAGAGKMVGSRAHIAGVRSQATEALFEAGGPGVEPGIGEGAIDTAEVKIADHITCTKRSYLLLVAIDIHHRVGRNLLGVARS